MMTQDETPITLGFRMPAEWEKHEATWLSWPKDPLTFPPNIIERVEQIYVEMIEALQKGERVDLLVDDQESEDRVSRLLSIKKNIRFHKIRSADVWMRDYGPIFVKSSKEVAAVKWHFNAWGNKYDELLRDDESGMEVCKSTGLQVFEPGIVLEGGSVDVNGSGLCLSTKQCLLNKNRNPMLDSTRIESYLHNYLGTTEIVWLSEGISGDDTDGHIDDIARFVNPDTVICMTEKDKTDDNYGTLEENHRFLEQFRNRNGEKLEVVSIRMPDKIESEDGRLPASYSNFYIGNSVVLVPIFGNERKDEEALSKIGNFFTNKEIIGINCRELVYGLGGIHCVTQQQPVGN